ncbi:Cytochrome p450 [Thalictrum thalictroides]|uniref:Cytochrome p450 n=1 Tax=Thalictrum thalictroides TaxID=46969 RepID=A0A7J6WS80_THATH|nr:Cytochrome p450 [Thalictrum thalictroides]
MTQHTPGPVAEPAPVPMDDQAPELTVAPIPAAPVPVLAASPSHPQTSVLSSFIVASTSPELPPTMLPSTSLHPMFLFMDKQQTSLCSLNSQQPQSVQTLLGKRTLLEVSDEDHKRIRGALNAFLKPEMLKQYVGNMDGEIKKHFEMHWQGKQTVTVMPLMKTLTFNIMCSLVFNLENGARREKFVKWFEQLIEGVWSIPVNFPFTRFNRSIQATTRIQNLIMDIIHEKRSRKQEANYLDHNDLISSLLSLRGDDNATLLSDQEIVDNVRVVMFAGYDTSSFLLTFLIRHLANDPVVYAAILKVDTRYVHTELDLLHR